MALHLGRECGQPQTLWEAKAEAIEQLCLGLVGPDDAADAKLTTGIVRGWENDVSALKAGEFIEDGPRRVAEARPLLPLLEGLPEDVGEEADEDVGLDSEIGRASCRERVLYTV